MLSHTPAAAYARPAYPYAHLAYVTPADVPSTTLMQVLYRALSTQRASGSHEEGAFVAWLCNRLPVTLIDEAGNIHVDTRMTSAQRTMFTSHTDTAHHYGGNNHIRLDGKFWRADEGACLGADDGAGIALMLHMLEAQVPGYYIFFRGEEVGGVGSRWLAENMPNVLDDIDRCISFDRADYSDVITHQAGGRCCSDAFAQALATALTREDLSVAYIPDDTGVFTDSANLTELVSECTNLSVGYKHQHGDGEWQDVIFLQELAAQLCTVQWDALPVERDPLVRSTSERGLFSSCNATRYKLAQCEETLVDALWGANNGHMHDIKFLVAEYIMPDDPDSVMPFINPWAIKPEIYEAYAEGLESGEYEYDLVLEILQDDLVKN